MIVALELDRPAEKAAPAAAPSSPAAPPLAPAPPLVPAPAWDPFAIAGYLERHAFDDPALEATRDALRVRPRLALAPSPAAARLAEAPAQG